MPYEVVYYAYGKDDRQPAEEFEDRLFKHRPKLLGKLRKVTQSVGETMPEPVGGGLFEKCHDFPGLWEVRTIFAGELARFLAGKDGSADPPRLVLLGGVLKQSGEKSPAAAFDRAANGWRDYERTKQISPEADEE